MSGAVPLELDGSASGTMNTFRQFGAVFGVALVGVVPGAVVTFVVGAVGALAGVVAVLGYRTAARPAEVAVEASRR